MRGILIVYQKLRNREEKRKKKIKTEHL